MKHLMRQIVIITVFLCWVLIIPSIEAYAQEVPNTAEVTLSNPELETRARSLMKEIRCLVCQNQSIDESDAPLAVELRQLVREQVAKGSDNTEIKNYLVERYGDWVLLSPPFDARTMFLWSSPILFLVIGLVLLMRRKNTYSQTPLSTQEQAILETINVAGPDNNSSEAPNEGGEVQP